VTHSSRSPAPPSSVASVSVASRARPGDRRTASPVTGCPCATSDSGPVLRARGAPARSVSPTEAPQVSMSTGRCTLPAISTAAVLA
jgi:hypothetical protein